MTDAATTPCPSLCPFCGRRVYREPHMCERLRRWATQDGEREHPRDCRHLATAVARALATEY